MNDRPLHAVLAGADALLGPLAAALDGTGPAVLPVDPGLPRPQLRRLLEELRPDAVRTPDGLVRSDAGGGLPVGDGTAVVIATSGLTGRPKGVELSAAALLASARASLDRIGAEPGERWLCCLPVSHVAGVQVLVRSLVSGTVPVIAGRLDPEIVASCGCAYVSLVPTQLRLLSMPGPAWNRSGKSCWAARGRRACCWRKRPRRGAGSLPPTA